jgi:hypothetical protein
MRSRTLLLGTAGAALIIGLLACGGRHDHRIFFDDRPSWTTQAVAVADLTGSGKKAVVSLNALSGNQAGFVTTRLQDAANPGAWLAPLRSGAGLNPGAFALAPNGALVVANRQVALQLAAANTVSVLAPNAAQPGTWQASATLPVGPRNPSAVAVGDLNADGLYDVVVAAEGGSDVLLYVQDPAGTFAAPVSLPVGGEPTALAVGDLNNDGLQDLVVATSGNTLSVLLQDPANKGAFLPHKDYTVGTRPVSVAIGSLAGTGLPDVVTANYGTSVAPTNQGISVLLHDPANPGGFKAAVAYNTGDAFASCVAMGDLNGDGKLDLAVANQGLPGLPGSVSVLLQDPANPGAFLQPVLYPGAYGPAWVAIGDVDGDGLADLVMADGGTFFRLQTTGSAGVFGPLRQFLQ